jgi:hypothetical protein
MISDRNSTPGHGWLAFEMNVLRRLRFDSIAIPFAGTPTLAAYLKRLGAKVSANDFTQSGFVNCRAEVLNNSETLTGDEVNLLLEHAYVPGTALRNPALRNWFGESDAWWFDNVRNGIERMASDHKRAIASAIAMQTGDYALSFDESTVDFRQPLSMEFLRMWSRFPVPVDNGRDNVCANKTAREFIAEVRDEAMFLRLPQPGKAGVKAAMGWTAWREEWIRGNDGFWSEMENAQMKRLGAPVDTKSQYLALVSETLKTASHIKTWAIGFVEEGVLTTQDVVDVIAETRKVDTVFGKDFSEITGSKAVIVTA